ncbi:lipoprotein [Mesoplasma seiffertii]|uniref:lipoprotein n=1 Tax=Mesoplasma seiffertii TaxID=28224 RepID=UPI00047B513A|nr:lipoprotein [Mesoplasma seiffertii]
MKKLLAILGAMTLTATTATTVVSCGTQLDQYQGNWSRSSSLYGWDYDAELSFDDLVSYLRYTAKLGTDVDQEDPNNQIIGIERNLITEAKLNNIMTLYKLLAFNLDGLINSLKPEEGTPGVTNSRATLTIDLDQENGQANKQLMQQLFLGLKNKNNFANKLNQAFSETLGTETEPWKSWEKFEDFQNEPGMSLILQANGTLDSKNELVTDGISSSLVKIKQLNEYLNDSQTKSKTTEQIANDIWDIFKNFDKFVNLGWTINKKVAKPGTEEGKEPEYEYPGLMVSFNIGIQSWRR